MCLCICIQDRQSLVRIKRDASNGMKMPIIRTLIRKEILTGSCDCKLQLMSASGNDHNSPLKLWGHGFESHSRHGSLAVFILCLFCHMCM
jgi:hypothetical protein